MCEYSQFTKQLQVHGPYIEFEPHHVCCTLRRHFEGEPPADAYYEWLEPEDGSGAKVYAQRRTVADLPNPPAGGFKGNRSEGYADYRPGKIYVAPEELKYVPWHSL